MKMQKLKKGQGMTVQNLAAIGIAFVVIVITFGMGGKVLDKMSGDAVTSENVKNESITLATAANASISCVGRSHFSWDNGTLTVQNGTQDDYAYIIDVDYLAYIDGTISWINVTEASSGIYLINYTCSYCNDTSCSAMENGTLGIAELSSWMPTIAIIIAAAIIIGVVTTYFYVKGT